MRRGSYYSKQATFDSRYKSFDLFLGEFKLKKKRLLLFLKKFFDFSQKFNFLNYVLLRISSGQKNYFLFVANYNYSVEKVFTFYILLTTTLLSHLSNDSIYTRKLEYELKKLNTTTLVIR